MCFKVSNDSHFDLGENILSTARYIIFMMQEFALSSLNIIISKEIAKVNRLFVSPATPSPNLAPDQISVNMRLLSPVFVFTKISLTEKEKIHFHVIVNRKFRDFCFYENFRSFIILK